MCRHRRSGIRELSRSGSEGGSLSDTKKRPLSTGGEILNLNSIFINIRTQKIPSALRKRWQSPSNRSTDLPQDRIQTSRRGLFRYALIILHKLAMCNITSVYPLELCRAE